MKKFFALLLAGCMLFGMTAIAEETKEAAADTAVETEAAAETEEAPALSFAAGTYEGIGEGIGGDVVVEVVLTENAIESVTVKSHNETAGVCDPAIEEIPAAIVAEQYLDVDTVTNATVTSNAIIDGAIAAMEAAGADLTPLGIEYVEFVPGTYTGVGDGIHGDVVVEVVVGEDAIESVTVLEHSETEGVCEPAIEEVPAAIVAEQYLDVDAATGATITSEAIMQAAANALAEAGMDTEAFGIVLE